MSEVQTEDFCLKELAQNIYVLPGSTALGVVAFKKPGAKIHSVYLIDSGPDRPYAQRVYDALEKEFGSFEVLAVVATHCHADHIGGNAFFKENTSCEIWATQEEKSGIEAPITQSALSTGGFPLPEFRTSYYYAERALVDRVICGGQRIFLDEELGIFIDLVPLPGHYMQMVGVLATNSLGEKVFFAGDGIFGRSMLSRYWMPFLFDVRKFKESVGAISKIKADFYVPSHGAVYDTIEELSEFNLLSTISNEKCIEKILSSPHTWEELLKDFADINEIPLRLSQYVLVGSTIRSYLSYLYEEGRIRWFFKDNRMFWQTTENSK